MLFKNAYEIVQYLHKHGKFEGIYVGLRGEYSIQTSLENPKLIELLDKIFDTWDLNSAPGGELNIDHGGFYLLDEDEYGELIFEVSISDDLLDSYGHPFDIEVLLGIICDELDLKTVDREDWLEYQICVELELEYVDLKNEKYEFNKFKVTSFEKGKIEQDLKLKLTDEILTKIKAKLAQYFAQLHIREHYSCYIGFNLKIDANSFYEYSGTGFAAKGGLKHSLEEIVVELEIEPGDIL